MTYAEQLQDPRWQRKRLAILNRDRFACQRCYSDQNTLHVHHRYYVSGRFPWEYPDFCYVTLCKGCHTELKTVAEDARERGVSPCEPWEVGLNLYGNDLLDLAVQDMADNPSRFRVKATA